jgi:hypothetical protein
MEALISVTFLTALFAIVGVVVARFGVDSRPGVGDDHSRSVVDRLGR